ncbi:YhjD/YihY/BrkB family envelope integrity protein [Kitasatospora herbaricolor]|uniref:YihY/virulence factor BrkB family protein n=1 Tax=Kitasatospora herbaricolor TaxID=68217 RepID=A0ABZ1W076_9ACTN|nr:YhjD/YihY/BrkB family envelope integrity protein [Kitasatospora herbaricolor]
MNRFQKIVGFDRSMALASSALTSLIPFTILGAAVLSRFGSEDVASRIISRYSLTGGGAEAVRSLFTPTTSEADPGVGVLGALFLMISVLSFTRAAQRLFEQTWELKPLSVRNTPNGLWWILSLAAYLTVTSWIRVLFGNGRLELGAALCSAPVTGAFLCWTGWILSARRIPRHLLLPFGIVASVLTAAYSMGASLYLPRLFSSYATRYGSLGAVLALISALFGAMLVIVASAALGREVGDELDRIRRGRRPADDEVRRQWANVVDQTRSRWHTAREQISRRRSDGRDKP